MGTPSQPPPADGAWIENADKRFGPMQLPPGQDVPEAGRKDADMTIAARADEAANSDVVWELIREHCPDWMKGESIEDTQARVMTDLTMLRLDGRLELPGLDTLAGNAALLAFLLARRRMTPEQREWACNHFFEPYNAAHNARGVVQCLEALAGHGG